VSLEFLGQGHLEFLTSPLFFICRFLLLPVLHCIISVVPSFVSKRTGLIGTRGEGGDAEDDNSVLGKIPRMQGGRESKKKEKERRQI